MFKSKSKKLTAFILSGFMAAIIWGTAIVSASPHDNFSPDHYDESAPTPHPPNRHWVAKHWEDGHWVEGHWENDR